VRYRFGDFALDSATRQLWRQDREVPLAPKAFELLELLIGARPAAVSKTRVRATLWPHTHVGATSLHVLASQVRAALGDDAEDPRWIRTVHRFGYAFAGAASEEGSPAEARRSGRRSGARLVGDRTAYTLKDGENIVGREAGLEVSLRTPSVSRRHARIVLENGRAVVEDLDSKNGTFVGGQRVSVPTILEDGDVIRLGTRTELVFSWAADATTEGEPS
jgi:DNA-binding winged helix-turn-helix (wHTH) protein